MAEASRTNSKEDSKKESKKAVPREESRSEGSSSVTARTNEPLYDIAYVRRVLRGQDPNVETLAETMKSTSIGKSKRSGKAPVLFTAEEMECMKKYCIEPATDSSDSSDSDIERLSQSPDAVGEDFVHVPLSSSPGFEHVEKEDCVIQQDGSSDSDIEIVEKKDCRVHHYGSSDSDVERV